MTQIPQPNNHSTHVTVWVVLTKLRARRCSKQRNSQEQLQIARLQQMELSSPIQTKFTGNHLSTNKITSLQAAIAQTMLISSRINTTKTNGVVLPIPGKIYRGCKKVRLDPLHHQLWETVARKTRIDWKFWRSRCLISMENTTTWSRLSTRNLMRLTTYRI